MTTREYQELLADLIAERDKIFNQIALLKSEVEQRHHFSMYGVSTNAEMIREVTAVLAQDGKWHYPGPIPPKRKKIMEVKLFDTYISRVPPSEFQHRERPYKVTDYPNDWHFLVGITPNFLTGTPIEAWAQEIADNLQRHVAVRYHYEKVSETDEGMITEIFSPKNQ